MSERATVWRGDTRPKAGRETDALVAEKVMGWSRASLAHCRTGDGGYYSPDEHGEYGLPHYSTDMSAAWTVVERLQPYHFDLGRFNDGFMCRLCVGTDNTRHFQAYGGKGLDPSDAALAICRAALLAVAATGTVQACGCNDCYAALFSGRTPVPHD